MDIDIYCNAAVKSIYNQNVRCPHKRKSDGEFCVLHSRSSKVIRYINSEQKNDKLLNASGVCIKDNTHIPELKPESQLESKSKLNKDNKNLIHVSVGCSCGNCSDSKTVKIDLYENDHKLKTTIDDITIIEKKREELTDIKTLLLIRNCPNIKELIGPVFDDITLSEDDSDPITMQTFWTEIDGKRHATNETNKYFLFSYKDSKNKIRCLSINTICDMINNAIYTHPITQELIEYDDIQRAIKLIEIFKKINFFETEKELTEQKIKSMTLELFHRFKIQGIELESQWFTGLNFQLLVKFTKDLYNICRANIQIIDPVKQFNLFSNKGESYESNITNEYLLKLKANVLIELNELLDLPKNKNNTIPYYIVVGSLANIVPKLKESYPDLQFQE
jgi:hypothetical protein